MSTLETENFSSPEALDQPPIVLTNSPEGREIIDRIQHSPDPIEDSQPVWDLRQSPRDEAKNSLQKRFFLSTAQLKLGEPAAVVKSHDAAHPINVPTRLVVDAQSFMSWAGRGPGVNKTISTDEGYKTLPSLDVMRLYATKNTTPPPIKEMDMFIQPNGKVFFSSGKDGAHRTGAAILSGRQNIDAYSLRVWPVPEDIL